IDAETLNYLRLTGRSREQIALVEAYAKAQGLWRTPAAEAAYSAVLQLDLTDVQPSLAGPRRPQDRVRLPDVKANFRQHLTPMLSPRNARHVSIDINGEKAQLRNGALVI